MSIIVKRIFRVVAWIIGIFLLLVIGIWSFITFSPAFGNEPSGASLERIKASKNYNGKVFENLVKTEVQTPDPQNEQTMAGFIYRIFFPPDNKNPSKPLPSNKFDGNQLENGQFVWLGHSTILFKTNDKFILTDPVFNNASPVPGSVPQFEMVNRPIISDLPEKIDVVLISHDHYDHLDYEAIQELDKRVSKLFVPLGVGAHLTFWGIDEAKIEEKDWYESLSYDSINFTFTPSRHFSGRGLNNRFTTLWGSWVIQSDSLNVFFSGDSGYFDEFKKIGEQFGPFDIAFMENGAYNTNWREIHFMPEQSVQASKDLNARLMFPIHWAKFDLSVHPWKEPIKRATTAASNQNVTVVTPLIGEVFDLQHPPQRTWWDFE
ncbi:MBL fold metallo-hydrolase [Fulvivirga lutea]|uniref:MBL fold metallo-hydrolase n=1 Tax=Fulvivirga lutea TaxID=2810512 RepID=A0A974WFN9_9BACT|nr:MBL fold metallo-hydrolase [Fulvivirga lutea]QSE96167.1 MBL fold metallo-hydrolase [Fulvivirga lutea]